MAVRWPLFIFLVFSYALTAAGHLYLADAWVMLRTAESAVTRGALDVPFQDDYGGKFAPDGKFYAKYGPAVAAHMLVPAVAAQALERLAPADPPGYRTLARGLVASFLNVPFAAATAAVFYAIALALGYRPRVALHATLLLAFGTMLWPYSKHDAFEPQMTAPLLLAFYLVLRDRPLAAGWACAWALSVKPVAVLAIAPLVVYTARRAGTAAAARLCAGPAAGVALLAVYNALRFGSPLETGYAGEVQSFTIPMAMGLYGLLLSAGKGLFWYSPALLLAFPGSSKFEERHPDEWRLVLATCGVHLVFYAVQQNWDGDWCWGPRYLLPCVPLLMLFALPVLERPREGWRRTALFLLTALAVFVQLLAVTVNPGDYVKWISDEKARFGDFLAQPQKVYIPYHPHHFNPDLSPLRGHFHMLFCMLTRRALPLVLYSSVEEHSDRAGHRLEKVVELPFDPERTTLDLWEPLWIGVAHGSAAATLAAWLAFAGCALGLTRFRRSAWRAVRDAEASSPG